MFLRKLSPASEATNVNDLIGMLYERAWAGKSSFEDFGRMQLIASPDEAEELFRNPDRFEKDYGIIDRIGRSRFSTDGEEWSIRRDLTQPLYRAAAQRRNAGSIRDAYEARLASMPDGACEELDWRISAAAAHVILSAFGAKSQGEAIGPALALFRDLNAYAQHISMFGGSGDHMQQLIQAVSRLRRALETFVAADEGLAAFFREMRGKADGKIDGFDPVGEFAINLFAGMETAAASTLWIVHALARRGEDQQRIHEEIAADPDATPFLDNFIQECLRYFPPAPLLVRKVAHAGSTIAGREVAKGQLFTLSIIGLHHNPDYWDNPRRFDPMRKEFAQNSYHRRAFAPFALGPRVCGGLGLARLEMSAAIKSLITHFEIAPCSEDLFFKYAVALRPIETASQLAIKRRRRG